LEEDSIDVHVLPARLVEFDESIPLKSYINSTTRPLSQIEFGEAIIEKSIAPALGRFSDRGQSFTNHSISKSQHYCCIASEPWSDKPSREHQKTELLYHVTHLNDMSSCQWNCSSYPFSLPKIEDITHNTGKTST